MKKSIFIAAALVITASLFLTGCVEPEPDNPTPKPEPEKPLYTKPTLPASTGTDVLNGTTWKYNSSSYSFANGKCTYSSPYHPNEYSYSYNSEKQLIYLVTAKYNGKTYKDFLNISIEEILSDYGVSRERMLDYINDDIESGAFSVDENLSEDNKIRAYYLWDENIKEEFTTLKTWKYNIVDNNIEFFQTRNKYSVNDSIDIVFTSFNYVMLYYNFKRYKISYNGTCYSGSEYNVENGEVIYCSINTPVLNEDGITHSLNLIIDGHNYELTELLYSIFNGTKVESE